MKQKRIIGRKDKVDLPDLGISDLEAKVDTGAYGNALHCHEMEVVEEGSVEKLRFKVLDPSHPMYKDEYFFSDSFRVKEVKSSIGKKEKRYVVKTKIRIFDKSYKTEFSLTNRKKMRHPMLIGRKFLSNKFLVDVKAKNLSYNMKTQEEK